MPAGAPPVGREIKEHHAKPSPPKLLGKCAHEGSLAGPAVHHEHARRPLGAVRLKHVGLEISLSGRDRYRAGIAQVKARSLDQEIMIGGAIAGKGRRAEPSIGKGARKGAGRIIYVASCALQYDLDDLGALWIAATAPVSLD